MEKIIYSILYFFLRFLDWSYRYTYLNAENINLAKAKHPQGVYLLAAWHQSLIPLILFLPKSRYVALVSASKDGEYVAQTLINFGQLPVRGSSTRGGKAGMMQMLRELKNGLPGVMTIDGPRGPAREAKAGIIQMAKISGGTIVPFSAMPQHFFCFKKSWDQFRLPYPFSKIIINIGTPIFVDKDIDEDGHNKAKNQLEEAINLGELTCATYLNNRSKMAD
ncbi:MAG: hypothetical protein A2504_13455 [Bdellovibrionales bacterium RIFOXYD12_FULL_39_22]|nr:MAG: hypothetical protein A2385_01255 [Bdellovibrionales bacterium RIFOXYB1_FULL_39_21]OFZ43633.1 MAG: hypothetical protein A2485_12925 [Bdellovibrionales bacterium RIFOXYC12_FULL_39_17]OFZ44652.1 MAG: hypothetical protein A2404_10615 [Bdellovibrionales bacterium RIFOXYC1_FULL_39_130]OFZ73057.1 MAG: hypothetical protein A2451_16110 [Bdellovibrionales bacterium RIFOXYC2_FULL_39_8]OFZ76411.1 MAG: hypothetical protein A2560_07235 [Bdellovibrionales bacterium RIFOXYD1_FULL_39_84]OFZ94677.1 MAG: